MFKKTTLVLGTLLAVVGFLISYNPVSAEPDYAKIRDEGFHAKYISQSIGDPVKIEAGETVAVTFKFKNIGTKTWDGNSDNFISAYTMNERYRASEFQATNWLEYRQTAKISGVVRPGEIGELELQLKAPEKTGRYKEEFWLAADGWSWMKGGYFYVEIDVVEKTKISEQLEPESAPVLETKVNDSNYQAKKFMQSKKEISAAGGGRVKLVVGYQNIGDTAWDGYSFVTDDASLSSSGGSVSFVDESWENDFVITKSEEQVLQWKAAREKFYIKMPHKKGDYTLTLKLQVANETLEETVLYIPVTVTEDAPSHLQPNTPVSQPKVEEKPRLDIEPTIRVGVWRDPEEGVEFISNDDDYIIYAGDTRKGVLKKGEFAAMFFAGGSYQYQSDSFNFMSMKYIRLVPERNKHAVFTLTNYDRKVSLYEKALVLFENRKEIYDKEVSFWNSKGGAPKEKFEDLERERIYLNNEAIRLNTEASSVNVLTKELNSLLQERNIKASEYNKVAEAYNKKYNHGIEFNQAEYTGKEINVYQFNTKGDLILAMTHEFGHALGMEHVENSKSIMYYLTSTNAETFLTPSPEDLAELNRVCE